MYRLPLLRGRISLPKLFILSFFHCFIQPFPHGIIVNYQLKKALYLLLLLAMPVMSWAASKAEPAGADADSVFVVSVLTSDAVAASSSTPGDVVATVARAFIGKPYVAGTLEVNAPDERLVINTRQVDCTTFVDQVLALSLTVLHGDTTYTAFCRNLSRLRYRDGKVQGYASRLHYFTDMVAANPSLLADVVPDSAQAPLPERIVQLGFMSHHPDSYPALKGHPEVVDSIRSIELRYQHYPVHYCPKETIASFTALREGDVVALMTTVEGLDVTHLGIAVRQPDGFHLLHASSAAGRVLVDPLPLQEMLASRKSCPGIRAVRLRMKE